MSFGEKSLLLFNRFFRRVEHPFNMQNDKKTTYAMWQYGRGAETLRLYAPDYSAEDILAGKRVLDFGCGAGGKSLYYASAGAAHVTGADIVERYAEDSAALARQLGLSDRFTFLCASALDLPVPDASFDTVIMNDFMEHICDPAAALREAMRVLAPGGRIFINFPPYYHPFGAHLSDAIGMPWIQLFYSEQSMISAYKKLIRNTPDYSDRVSLRFSEGADGREHITYINKMTIKKFSRILKAENITPVLYREKPLRRILKPLARFPLTREAFVGMVTVVIEK